MLNLNCKITLHTVVSTLYSFGSLALFSSEESSRSEISKTIRLHREKHIVLPVSMVISVVTVGQRKSLMRVESLIAVSWVVEFLGSKGEMDRENISYFAITFAILLDAY